MMATIKKTERNGYSVRAKPICPLSDNVCETYTKLDKFILETYGDERRNLIILWNDIISADNNQGPADNLMKSLEARHLKEFIPCGLKKYLSESICKNCDAYKSKK